MVLSVMSFCPTTKFLNFLPPSINLTQCQTVLRSALKPSSNETMKFLWKDTSTHTNVQYDQYRNTNEIIESFRNEHENKFSNTFVQFIFVTRMFLILLKFFSFEDTASPMMEGRLPRFKIFPLEAPASKSCNKSIQLSSSTPFPDVMLAINFNHPFYKNIPILERYYKRLFSNYIFCGPEVDPNGQFSIVVIEQVKPEYGYYGYQCLVESMRRKPGMAGYFYINDDMIINWWNFYFLDKTKIWFSGVSSLGVHKMMPTEIDFWWKRADCLVRCSQVFVEMEADIAFFSATKTYFNNAANQRVCTNGLSDILFIPGRLAKSYELISQKFYDHRVFLEVATPMTILMLSEKDKIVDILGLYLQRKYGWGSWTSNSERAWLEYNYKVFFLHPYKFFGNNQTKNTREFEDRVLAPSERILKTQCLDVLDKGKFWV